VTYSDLKPEAVKLICGELHSVSSVSAFNERAVHPYSEGVRRVVEVGAKANTRGAEYDTNALIDELRVCLSKTQGA
jgi:hypothetical protein